ncbi:MAG: RtcB family protein [Fimbriimonadaceae bacterium]|nr:RtcB family protein [Fimbriimonadaceae bacterium]
MTHTQNLTTFGPVEPAVLEQINRCRAGDGFESSGAVLCADNHLGYSMPIGGAIAYPDHISPSGVGYDIGCGNKAVRTNLTRSDLFPAGTPDVRRLMNRIVSAVGFGVGRPNPEPVEHPVLDAIRNAAFEPQRKMLDMAAKQLGTVGGGNHYVDVFADELDRIWIGVHFGSRGFGHRTASGFLALAQGAEFTATVSEGGMHAPPTLLRTDSDVGQAYVCAMQLAGDYAYAGRDLVVDKVLSLMDATAEEAVHNHHNFAWRETHFGTEAWVVRKGCTPAFPGQRGFVGGSMGDISVILEGVESDRSAAAMYSTVHGAGRVLSRTAAAGKSRFRGGRKVTDGGGLVDWPTVRASLWERGIVVKGSGADEAPECYRPLGDVLNYHAETIRIVHTLTPLGVAMADGNTHDPYKD